MAGVPSPARIVLRGRAMRRDRPLIMAVINRTPDSFFDNGATFDAAAAATAITRAVQDGADIIDIGGVRAGAQGADVDTAEELRRVLPIVTWIRENHPAVAISVDTWRHEVGRAACQEGAHLINDTWAAADPRLMEVAAEFGAGYVCSHAGGLGPRTDPHRPSYTDVVAEVTQAVVDLAERGAATGVPTDGILIDPTLDFGKNTWHSLALLRHLDVLVETGWPVLVALSNKDFIGETLDAGPAERGDGTLAAHTVAALAGAAAFRVHDVPQTRRVLETVSKM